MDTGKDMHGREAAVLIRGPNWKQGIYRINDIYRIYMKNGYRDVDKGLICKEG
jgi:hypothetical protein